MPAPINKTQREESILAALTDASTREQVQHATGLTEWQVKTSIKHLVADGSVIATGECSERRYQRART